jgi:hypothetical protein
MTPTTIDGFTFWTKTVANLKKETYARRKRLWEAKHRLDPVNLISIMLTVGLVLSTATFV